MSEWLEAFAKQEPGAREALISIGTNAIPFLLEWITSTDSTVKRQLITQLNEQSNGGLQIKSSLYRQMLACKGFEALGTNGLPAMPRLASLLQNTNTSRWAAVALAEIGSDAFRPLTRALTNGNNELARCHAAMALERNHNVPPFVVDALIKATRDQQYAVRAAACEALGRVASESFFAVSALKIAVTDTNRAVRYSALDALGHFGARAIGAIDTIITATNDSDILVRNTAISALRRISPEALVE